MNATTINKQDELKKLVPRFILLNGETFVFTNEPYQVSIKNDDIRNAEISFKKGKYFIWFNGSLIYECKNYTSVIHRLMVLADKWNLSFSGIVE